jgi:hypothetical protein
VNPELFKLECWRCNHVIEISINPPFRCVCGADLQIDWGVYQPNTTESEDEKKATQ